MDLFVVLFPPVKSVPEVDVEDDVEKMLIILTLPSRGYNSIKVTARF